MTENIRSIFEQNIRLLKGLDMTIFHLREQQLEKALALLADSADRMKASIEAVIKNKEYFNLVSEESVLEMLSGILSAWKNRDYVLLADFLELQMVSFLCGVQELIISKEEKEFIANDLESQFILFGEHKYSSNMKGLVEKGIGFDGVNLDMIPTTKLLEDGYRVEFTSCGLMTLVAENAGLQFYFHTNSRVHSESIILASRWHEEGINKYIIYGFGMGYHINMLQELAPEAEIELYEADMNVIKLAAAFSNMNELVNMERITFIYDPDFSQLQSRLSHKTSEERFILHYPSYQNIRSDEGRKMLESYIPWSKNL